MMTRLYEYLPEEDRFQLHFRLEDVTIQQERAIRASKIHTSITEINDGRLIMTTHTTARSPEHPDWMPHAYYGHPWEGYQGSHILLYDYLSGKVEDRGIPSPLRASMAPNTTPATTASISPAICGGTLCRYDLDTNRVTDYGKVTEFGSFRIAEGRTVTFTPAPAAATSTASTWGPRRLNSWGVELPDNNGIHSRYHRIISYSVCAQGKMYISPPFHRPVGL